MAVAQHGRETWDPFQLTAALGIRVRFEPLAAGDRGIQSMLLPEREGSFTIVCDPWIAPYAGSEVVIRERLAHELAHTLFYDWRTAPPSLVNPSVVGNALEQFCDAFADALTRYSRS
jgi:hypothetical protein